MDTINVDSSIPLSAASSKGDQAKWRTADGYYVKSGLFYCVDWQDYKVEVIGTQLCQQLYGDTVEYAQYHPCKILSGNHTYLGCYSKSFLKDDESIVTFHRFAAAHDIQLAEAPGIADVYLFLCKIMREADCLNYDEYLAQVFLVDYLLGGTDRHLNNFALVYNSKTHVYKPAPLFDFGVGLFQGFLPSLDKPFKEIIKLIRYKPYGVDFPTVMHFYKTMGYIQKYIPQRINVRGWDFPNQKAALLFIYQCRSLNIKIIGITKEDVLCLT